MDESKEEVSERKRAKLISNATGRDVTSLLITLNVNLSGSKIHVAQAPGLARVDPRVAAVKTHVLRQSPHLGVVCPRRRQKGQSGTRRLFRWLAGYAGPRARRQARASNQHHTPTR
jgi:hypothetical protein